jgi:hypothetical protein
LVEVRCTDCEFANIADAVVVAVSLCWVRDGRAVVGGVGSTVAVGVGRDCNCDGVVKARRDARARPEVSGSVALAVVVVSPAPDATIASECNGVFATPRCAGARADISRRVALTVVVVSPAVNASIDSECDGVQLTPGDA